MISLLARFCSICENKLSFFHRAKICQHCQVTKFDAYFNKEKILKLPHLSDDELDKLKNFGILKTLKLYNRLLEAYLEDQIMTEEEIANLKKISSAFSLSTTQSQEGTVIRPHKIQNFITKYQKLPELGVEYFEDLNINLKENEKLFDSGSANLYERRAVSQYIRGSRGVTVFGIRGIGRVQGQRVSHKEARIKSEGSYVITDKAFYYIPNMYGSMIKLKIDKILKYDYNDEFLYIFKHGRQNPYLFHMNFGDIKICVIGLNFIFGKSSI